MPSNGKLIHRKSSKIFALSPERQCPLQLIFSVQVNPRHTKNEDENENDLVTQATHSAPKIECSNSYMRQCKKDISLPV